MKKILFAMMSAALLWQGSTYVVRAADAGDVDKLTTYAVILDRQDVCGPRKKHLSQDLCGRRGTKCRTAGRWQIAGQLRKRPEDDWQHALAVN